MVARKIPDKLNRSANLPFKYIFNYPNMGTFYAHQITGVELSFAKDSFKGGRPTALTGTT